MAQTFFGLTPSDKDYFLEPIFALMYYLGFSYSEAYSLPIWQRRWFIKRIQKEIKDSSDNGTGASRGAQHNSADARSLLGRTRNQVPAKLRRFS